MSSLLDDVLDHPAIEVQPERKPFIQELEEHTLIHGLTQKCVEDEWIFENPLQ